ncbi:extracellular solute-binding protein [Staphylococcus canis]|uniref:Extracellular solute-binding protein n=1 Tax=Staphylococcus canis TaxID=2724942 RepID=A0ABS0T7V0_9STAP|nr:extracellular solute-binding protein [Staphylococcus canis]MBI5974830.1 extracellular solute-binding protein [Staphylococcus canis]
MKYKIYAVLCVLIILSGCTSTEQRQVQSEVLKVYSPYPMHLIRPILNDFERQENVKVEVIQGSTQTLLSRVHQESPMTRGDVFLGGVLSDMIDHPKDFVPYHEPSASHQYVSYRSQDDYVTSFILMPIVIVVNEDLKGDIPIRGYTDLMHHPALNTRVAYSNPNTTTTGYQHMRAIYSMSNEIQDVHHFQNQAVRLDKTSKVINDVAKGKYYAGLSYEQEARTWQDKGYPISIIYPREGTLLNVDGIALINNAHPHPKREQLVHYLTSRPIQQRLVSEFGIKSIRQDISESRNDAVAQFDKIPLLPKSKLPSQPHDQFLEMIQ